MGSRKVHEGDGRVRNLGVPVAIVADERCPRLTTQYFVEFDPGCLQLAQSPGGSCYPVILDGQHLTLSGSRATSLLEKPLALCPRLTTGLPFSQSGYFLR